MIEENNDKIVFSVTQVKIPALKLSRRLQIWGMNTWVNEEESDETFHNIDNMTNILQGASDIPLVQLSCALNSLESTLNSILLTVGSLVIW